MDPLEYQARQAREEQEQRDLQSEVRRALKSAGLSCRTSRGKYGVTVFYFDARTPEDFHAWARVQPALEAAGFRVSKLNGSYGRGSGSNSGPRLLANRQVA